MRRAACMAGWEPKWTGRYRGGLEVLGFRSDGGASRNNLYFPFEYL
jgi:hypothetical protein